MTNHFDGITLPFEASEPLNLKAEKPSAKAEIDADVRSMATIIVDDEYGLSDDTGMTRSLCISVARRAIQAERARCERVAFGYEISLAEYPNEQAKTYYQAGSLDMALGIASAIRRPPTHASTKAIEGEKA